MRCFLIRRTEDNTLIGAVNLSSIMCRAYKNAVLSYSLGARYTGHRYMAQACALAVDFAFKKDKPHRVEANI